jgi:hypothetical protein
MKSRRVALTARVLAAVFAAVFATATLSGCAQLFNQLHELVPHTHAPGQP